MNRQVRFSISGSKRFFESSSENGDVQKRDVYDAEAEGKRKVNEAANTLSAEQIAMQIRQALIAALPAIIEQTVKPMERIEGIKILQIDGLHAQGSGGNGEAPQAGLADQAVNAALRYRTQVPILDALMAELGLTGAELGKLPAMAAPKPNENEAPRTR